MPFIYYFDHIYLIQPFKKYSIWSLCKEYLHIKHLMFWILILLNYQLLLMIDSVGKNQSSVL